MSAISNRFLSAVRLCIGPLTIKKRLTIAWTEHLDDIDPDELPEQVRNRFIVACKAMYERVPLPSETAPVASIRKMSTRDAVSHTDTIVDLYTEIVESQNTQHQTGDSAQEQPENIASFAVFQDRQRRLN